MNNLQLFESMQGARDLMNDMGGQLEGLISEGLGNVEITDDMKNLAIDNMQSMISDFLPVKKLLSIMPICPVCLK